MRMVIAAALLALLAGCNKPAAAPAAGPESATVTTGAWPAELPGYAPAYPGATVTAAFAGSSDGAKRGGMVAFTTADAPERVVSFYRDEAKRAGLGEVATMSGSGAQMLSASDKASQRSLAVQAGPDGGATAVTLTYGAAQ